MGNSIDKLDNKYIFIICPGKRAENIPQYKIVQSNGEVLFPLSIFNNKECLPSINEALADGKTVEKYLELYEIQKTTVYNIKNKEKQEARSKKQKVVLIIEDDETPKNDKDIEEDNLCIEKCSKQLVKKECNIVTKRCVIPRLNKTKKLKKVKPITKLNLIIENDDENLSPKNVANLLNQDVIREPIVEEPIVSELIIREPVIEEPIVINNDSEKCIERCSKEPIKTKCNTLTKRCIAPIKKINKSKKIKQKIIFDIID